MYRVRHPGLGSASCSVGDLPSRERDHARLAVGAKYPVVVDLVLVRRPPRRSVRTPSSYLPLTRGILTSTRFT